MSHDPERRPILVLQHAGCEPPGAYEDELLARRVAFTRVVLDEDQELPDWRAYSGIVAMGGAMSVNDEAGHPWLIAEKRLVSEAVGAGMPYWGVCLGAQLLAAVLGARVSRGERAELGVLPVELTAAAAQDPVFAGAPASFQTLQWHGETYELPPGAVQLARSLDYEQQAFVVGRAYALQFHLEVDSALAERMDGRSRLRRRTARAARRARAVGAARRGRCLRARHRRSGPCAVRALAGARRRSGPGCRMTEPDAAPADGATGTDGAAPADADDAVHTIELDGRRFAWRTLGAGRPLLLINGYAATSADWDPTLLDALGGSLQLICPDNRGMGESELGDASQLSIESMALDLERLLDALGIERLAVAGWSMGSYVAQSLATRSPARVSELVLLAGAPPGPTAISGEPRVWQQLIDHSGRPREQATRLISLLFPPDVAPQIDREFGEIVAEARAGLSQIALEAQERALLAWHAEPQPLPGPARRRCWRSAAARTSSSRPRTRRRWPRAGPTRASSASTAVAMPSWPSSRSWSRG